MSFNIIGDVWGIVWSVSILKILKGSLSDPLQIILNASFLTGIVPERFKLARFIPVFKKGSQASLNNYRPISLLSIFNKLLEKMVYNRLSNYLEEATHLQ